VVTYILEETAASIFCPEDGCSSLNPNDGNESMHVLTQKSPSVKSLSKMNQQDWQLDRE
jgi:hypothetical protein